MKIDIVLVSSNDNPIYYTFYPYIKKFWEKILGVKCLLVYVGYSLPDVLKEFSDDIFIFDPIQNINTAFIAQNIRLLYPCLLSNYSNGILISDIDMIPLSSKYFIKKIIDCPDNSFINYTWEPVNIAIKQYYMCYNIATYQTWREIFDINCIQDITDTLTKWYSKINYHFDEKYRSKCKGFCNDQLMLYKYVNFWNSQCLLNNHNIILEQDDLYMDEKINNVVKEVINIIVDEIIIQPPNDKNNYDTVDNLTNELDQESNKNIETEIEKKDEIIFIKRTINNIYEFSDDIDVIKLNPRLILLQRDTKRLIADNKSFGNSLIKDTMEKIKNYDDFHIPKKFNKNYINNIFNEIYY